MLDTWLGINLHKVVHKINAGRFVGRFIVMEVSDPNTKEVLHYSIDNLTDYGVLKDIPAHNENKRRRFDTLEAAINHLKAGIECLKK